MRNNNFQPRSLAVIIPEELIFLHHMRRGSTSRKRSRLILTIDSINSSAVKYPLDLAYFKCVNDRTILTPMRRTLQLYSSISVTPQSARRAISSRMLFYYASNSLTCLVVPRSLRDASTNFRRRAHADQYSRSISLSQKFPRLANAYRGTKSEKRVASR